MPAPRRPAVNALPSPNPSPRRAPHGPTPFVRHGGSTPLARDDERPRPEAEAGAGGTTGALFAEVYAELHAIARRCLRGEGQGHTLQATALVHEAFLQLARAREQRWSEPVHLLAIAARTIRRTLINHALARRTERRGGGRRQQALPDAPCPNRGADPCDVLALGDALAELERLDPRQGAIVELRFFGGLSVPEVARVLGVSTRTVEGEWSLARAWLRCRMGRDEDEQP